MLVLLDIKTILYDVRPPKMNYIVTYAEYIFYWSQLNVTSCPNVLFFPFLVNSCIVEAVT